MIPNLTLVIQGLAFFAVVLMVMKLGWPHIIAAIEDRQNKIAEGLSQAEKARKELADADARVADEIRKARAEAMQIIDKAHQQAAQIVDKARQDAIVEATKQKAIAAADIEAQAHKAREELRGKVAALAVAGAEKILKREIDANAHKSLIDQLVTEI
ncbi:F0F1 ATP synthase subunit B [Dokdonella fugitiva]|uniref:ATP synthase subunit b n=1 Tax=Dokdonella fugitiva TaxID=328517 RepID=A0A4R2IB37_9GAMM|nr:F0F1 ATP synthase subunit B [Dokdonella fugitiva]MBA8883573.1 F-type H+-transporting ATPase subunit b [Dokdonella fugitiva]TCO41316.1 F-type H+-transporting ATPase subunit b [Dokdonella fugitiva]